MKRFMSLATSIFLVLTLTLTVGASKSPYVEKRVVNSAIYQSVVQYSVPIDNIDKDAASQALYDVKALPSHPGAEQSPGLKVGETVYEYQHNNRIPRMIARGVHGTPDTMLVHFGWHYDADSVAGGRSYCYN